MWLAGLWGGFLMGKRNKWLEENLQVDETWRFSSAHFIFGTSIRKQQTMVKLQLAENAIE